MLLFSSVIDVGVMQRSSFLHTIRPYRYSRSLKEVRDDSCTVLYLGYPNLINIPQAEGKSFIKSHQPSLPQLFLYCTAQYSPLSSIQDPKHFLHCPATLKLFRHSSAEKRASAYRMARTPLAK